MTDRNQDFSQDEVRRSLREVQADHRASLPGWRRTLGRIMDPASGTSDDEKAAVLGVPRRGFMVGGVVLAGGAVLAACSKKSNDEQLAQTGTRPTLPATTTTTAPGSPAKDLVLLRTAQSIEILAIDTYQQLLSGDLVTDQSVKDTFTLFQSQHQDHSDALADAIREANGQPVTQPNAYLTKTVITPGVAALTDQESVLKLAREVENIATQTYVEAGSVFSTPQLRQSGMSVGETEARHVTVLNITLGYNPVPLPTIPTALAIDPKGYLTSSSS